MSSVKSTSSSSKPSSTSSPFASAIAHLRTLSRTIALWPDANSELVTRVVRLTNSILSRGYLSEELVSSYDDDDEKKPQTTSSSSSSSSSSSLSTSSVSFGMGGHVEAKRRETTMNTIASAMKDVQLQYAELLHVYMDMQAAVQSIQFSVDDHINRSILTPSSTPPSASSSSTSPSSFSLSQADMHTIRIAERCRELCSSLISQYAAELSLKASVIAHLRPQDLPFLSSSGSMFSEDTNITTTTNNNNNVPPTFVLPPSAHLPVAAENDQEYMLVQVSAIAAEAFVQPTRVSTIVSGLEVMFTQLL